MSDNRFVRLNMKNGYYLIRNMGMDELTGYDIASFDVDARSWTFCGDDRMYDDHPSFKVIKYICDPECMELR